MPGGAAMIGQSWQATGQKAPRLIESLAARGRSMLTLIRGGSEAGTELRALGERAAELISPRGEVEGARPERRRLRQRCADHGEQRRHAAVAG